MPVVHSIIKGLFRMQKLTMGETRVGPEAHLTEDSRSGHPIRTHNKLRISVKCLKIDFNETYICFYIMRSCSCSGEYVFTDTKFRLLAFAVSVAAPLVVAAI